MHPDRLRWCTQKGPPALIGGTKQDSHGTKQGSDGTTQGSDGTKQGSVGTKQGSVLFQGS